MPEADHQPTTLRLRTRFDGANIRTWVGFRQFLALAEEAVLGWFRDRDLGPQRLFHEHSLALGVVDAAAQLPGVLEVDDEVDGEARHRGGGEFAVRLTRVRDRQPVLRGRLRVVLGHEPSATPADPGEALPSWVPLLAADRIAPPPAGRGPSANGCPPAGLGPRFRWSWTARYFHCHYSRHVQHAAFVRALEEVVDRFLADRGLAIPEVLEGRGWIPVVSRVRVQMLEEVRMGEAVETVFGIDDLVKDVAYDGSMGCYVLRQGEPVLVATGQILHGYAATRGAEAGRLVRLDPPTTTALTGGSR